MKGKNENQNRQKWITGMEFYLKCPALVEEYLFIV